MKYTIHVNQKQALEIGIVNINQAVIFDFLTGVAAWAEPVVIDGDVYYWVARQKIAKELEILNFKPDTIYRHLKSLIDIGVIDHIKSGVKDCIRITELGKSYYISNESTMSDNNPSHYVGYPSESPSDIHPTYKTTKEHKTKSESVIENKIKNPETRELFYEYIELRKKLKLQTTDKIITRLVNKYIEYGGKKIIIENAITANWKDFYPLKADQLNAVTNIDLGMR